jgi:hypothetical protein
MKISTLFAAAGISAALFLSACGNSEKEALEDFKKSAEELNALTKEAPDASDPMAGLTKVKTVSAKMDAIKTDGLPADLKEAFTAFRAKFNEMAAVLKGMPEKKEEMLAWAQKMMTDPELSAKMAKLGQELEPLGQKFTEVAKKHGIDVNMNK